MPIEELPGVIVTPTRDEERQKWLRDYQLMVPDADVGPGTQPYVDASIAADSQMVVFNDAIVIGNGTNLDTSAGSWLLMQGEARGVGGKLPATGGSGYVIIGATSGGTTIFADDEIKEPQSGLRFKCLATALYLDNALVPIGGIDTGPSTNLAPATQMEWTSPRPGCNPVASVYEQSDGSGLTGGHDIESDEEYRQRIKLREANPPASGNDAEYQAVIESTPDIAIQKAFTYPAVFGPGSMAFAFTLKPSIPGSSRIPNASQINEVRANLEATEPGDDGVFPLSMISSPVAVMLEITWADGAIGWTDSTTWPVEVPSDPVLVTNASPITATSFRVVTGTTITNPQVGQTIGVFEQAGGLFRKKRIASIVTNVSGKDWTLTFATSNNASDTTYAPADGQIVSPWSDSLDSLIAPIVDYFAQLGPGEMFPTFYDPGRRQRRNPRNPGKYPSTLTNRMIRGVLDTITVGDVELIRPSVPLTAPIGTPGVLVYLYELGDLSAFPQT